MRTFFLFIVFILSGITLFAQLSEAKIQTANASAAIDSKNYSEAIQYLNKSKKAILNHLENLLAANLPAKIDNWVLSDDAGQLRPNMGMMSMAGANDIVCKRIYKNEDTKISAPIVNQQSANSPLPSLQNTMTDGPNIRVSISNSTAPVSQFISEYGAAMGGQNANMVVSSGGMGYETATTLKIKGYRAMEKTNAMMKTTEISIVVGGGIIQITGQELDKKDVLYKIAELIDFAKIKSIIGE